MESTEYVAVNEDGSSTKGPSLVQARMGHCLVKMDPWNVLLIGGEGPKIQREAESQWLDTRTEKWSLLSNATLNVARFKHGCGTMIDRDTGQKVILVLGGTEEDVITDASNDPDAYGTSEYVILDRFERVSHQLRWQTVQK